MVNNSSGRGKVKSETDTTEVTSVVMENDRKEGKLFGKIS